MRKQKIWLLIMFFLPAISVCGDGVYKKSGKGFRDLNKNGKLDPYENPAESMEVRLQDLLRQMTLEEKVGQLAHTLGWNYYEKDERGQVRLTDLFRSDLKNRHIGCFWATLRADPWTRKTLKIGLSPEEAAEMTNLMQRYAQDSTRLGIPLFLAEECPHGHMAIGTTVFPTAIGRASTWNPELEKRAAGIVALEARLQGGHIGYGPVLDVARELRWSRVEEGYGEDPFLSGSMGSAYVRGLQGEDVGSGENVIATLKHFTAYGVPEGGHNAGMAHVGVRELLTELSYPFEMAVKAGALSLMTAYNEVDGIPCTANPFLTNQLLREQWGFSGFVVSDLYSIDGLVSQRVAANREEAGMLALRSGVDSDLGGNCFAAGLVKACREGRLAEADIDRAACRVLRLKFEMGLFDNPYVEVKKAGKQVGTPEHREVAREVARQSVVLLKNENKLLPLSKEVKRVAIVGPNADNVYNQLGDYTAPQAPGSVITVFEGIRQKLPGAEIRYVKGCAVRDTLNTSIEEACEVAKNSEVVVVVLGGSSARDFETDFLATGAAVTNARRVSDMESGEGFDRTGLSLMGKQLELLKALYATGKPIVLVMIQGRPLELNWAAEHIPAILTAWYPGGEGGRAIADVLFGDYNPAGRLPLSYPRHVGQLPVYYNHKSAGRHDYVEGTAAPLYPFGYGLSYTTFAYDGVKTRVEGDSVRVSVDVRNSGNRAGDEVVQLYLRDEQASVVTPFIQLKAFRRVSLAAGESRTVEFVLTREHLKILDLSLNWVVEPGFFTVLIGSSSSDIRLTTRFRIN